MWLDRAGRKPQVAAGVSVTDPMGADTPTPPASGTDAGEPEEPLPPLPVLYERASHAVLNLRRAPGRIASWKTPTRRARGKTARRGWPPWPNSMHWRIRNHPA